MSDSQNPRRPTVGRSRSQVTPVNQWTPAIGAALVLLIVIVVGVVASNKDSSGIGSQTTTTIDQILNGSTVSPIIKVPLSQTLGKGSAGAEIKMVQDRLIELNFDPGEPDGVFGERTRQAIWAFEKLVMGVQRENITGKVDEQMWSRMQDPLEILPRRPDTTPNHTEVYLPEQVLIVFRSNVPAIITHISSGTASSATDEEWCEEVTISPGEQDNETGTQAIKKGVCGVSWTPGGVYKFYRLVVGRRESQLGGMYNPVYFNKGIAVHGAQEVPAVPASHGCIRLPMHISEYFQTLVSKGDQVFVFDGVKEPEEYGAQSPRFNWVDPNYTTTTSSTVPTATTTTVATTTSTVPTATTTTVATTTVAP